MSDSDSSMSTLRRSSRLVTATLMAQSVSRRPVPGPSRQVHSITAVEMASDNEEQRRPTKKAKLEVGTLMSAQETIQGKRTSKKQRNEEANLELEEEEHTNKPKRIKAKKKKREAIEPTATDFLPRASNSWKIGAHVSAAGGVENSILNAATIGANAFALFLKSQRKWTGPALNEDSIAKFKRRLAGFDYSLPLILPHGSYLINLGNPDDEKREKAYACFLDELKRCEELGLQLYNFHPGSTVGAAASETCLTLIAECLNRAHKETDYVVTVLENMAGAGNVIGSTFSDLGSIVGQVRERSRVGVCLDTCHMFAAGYDIRTKDGWQSMMSEFDNQVGLEYLRGMHLNDSKCPLGSKKDRHENIGLGHLGLSTFHHILTDERLQNIPLVMETPQYDDVEVWKKELEVLNRLSSLTLKDDGEPGEVGSEAGCEDGSGLSETLAAWTEEIRRTVEKASSMQKKKKTTKKTRIASKTVRLAEDEESSELSELTEDQP